MLGIIGGTGLSTFFDHNSFSERHYDSLYGAASGPVTSYEINNRKVCFLPRHGHPHKVPPHLINYRANLECFRQAGVTRIIAVNAVGGIHPELGPTKLCVPDQILDYTSGREHTIFDDVHHDLNHIDFSFPYDPALREGLLAAADDLDIGVLDGGTYVATQGPRLETAAEIALYKQQGGAMVGMTGMPEAALAREMGLDYACLALSVNWAAGLTKEIITLEDIGIALNNGMTQVAQILDQFMAAEK